MYADGSGGNGVYAEGSSSDLGKASSASVNTVVDGDDAEVSSSS